MAIYRNVSLSFWTDNKVEDDFTPEDKYFYLYLLTNPQTNICGCYEVSYSQMINQTGYNKETINRLIERLDKSHNIIRFCKETKEILILNWYKYNWSKSEKVLTGVESVAKYIKCKSFKDYILHTVDCIRKDTLSIGYEYPMETSVSDTDSVSDSVSVSVINNINNKRKTYKDILKDLLEQFDISDSLLESINDWLDYKRERNFSYKEKGLRTLLKTASEKAKKYGDNAVKSVIDESISCGYQGITWDKVEKIKKKNESKEVTTYESESTAQLW